MGKRVVPHCCKFCAFSAVIVHMLGLDRKGKHSRNSLRYAWSHAGEEVCYGLIGLLECKLGVVDSALWK